ncbi:MAG: DUF2309 domain-containing protein [Deltaproteobacteria bacterium]|nr:MAG: DUF2309 domain-containing protein [Deltaproteobacteria bacterium]
MSQELAIATDLEGTRVAARQQLESEHEALRPLEGLDAALDEARTRIAPLWPLQSFVAVNPFLSLAGKQFEEACNVMKRVAGADMLMPRAFYRELIASGRITDADLRTAISGAQQGEEPVDDSVLADWKSRIAAEESYAEPSAFTAADVLDAAHGTRASAEITEQISKWCSAYWDEGQAAWRMPWRSMPLYRAWRAASEIDRSPEVLGFKGFRKVIATLPDEPISAITHIVETLALPKRALDAYFFRVLFGIRGWAAYARYLGWSKELDGEKSDTVIELLAVRLAWDYAVFMLNDDDAFRGAWVDASVAMVDGQLSNEPDPELLVDSVLQAAFDASFQRELLGKLAAPAPEPEAVVLRKPLQAAFCIDVRSEVFRRALERVAPDVQTIGFAGFFGFPIEYVPIGQQAGTAQCPVLLKPKFVVHETVAGADEDEKTEILGLRLLRRRAAKAWKSFKSSAVSSFVYVETAGLTFAPKLASDALGATRTVKHPSADGLDDKVLPRTGPDIAHAEAGGRTTGFSETQRIDMAEGVLKAMSLRSGFARLVMLAGHGSTTVNNPHASGLDCGACGGNAGEPNARVAAMILNDPDVRAGLAERGITITADTWFLGCLHDTTTDEISIFDREHIPETHAEDLKELEQWLSEASSLARAERSSLLGVPNPADADTLISRRSRDWSQPRPEWGLAGNAAFIAAPRARTRHVDLDGRAFLHDYDWRQDEDFSVLELIMTAPMVVASWINLQYYGSAVNTAAFGCGNKVLHNVVGTIGVLQGNGGDLQTGLSWQSVHDGKRFIHEPLRLNVFIEAPTEQLERVLEKHESVAELVENEWIYLFALADDGHSRLRYDGGAWVPVA